jgi:hypothetical protein
VIGNFELLLRRIDNQFESPVVFLDSASGIQGSALMGLIAADLLVIFFRWSRQFINGTKQFIREQLIGSGDGRTRLRKVLLVPTAVPATSGSDQGYAARVYQELQEEVDSMNRAARENLMKLGDWISIAPAVPEAEALKWDDQIFTPSYTKKNGSGRGVGALVQAYDRLSAEILHQAERPART